jgi:enamine deaminase RidA (YjgF/YER057c/UK114 family)
METLQPPGWPRPHGYSNGVAAEGRLVFVAGQIGWDETGAFPAEDMAGQVRQTLRNIVAVLAEAGAAPEHVTRLTWYVTDREAYLADPAGIGQAYRDVMGRHFPAMAVVVVSALLEPSARVEIEATAVVPR